LSFSSRTVSAHMRQHQPPVGKHNFIYFTAI